MITLIVDNSLEISNIRLTLSGIIDPNYGITLIMKS